MNRVAVGVGSNINPIENIAKAREILSSEFRLLQASDFKKTKPIGSINHPDFINGALLLETHLSQDEFKNRLHDIEEQLGRPRNGNRSAPRTIDLDLVIWNGKVMDPDIYEREFLKAAVLEIWPDLKNSFINSKQN